MDIGASSSSLFKSDWPDGKVLGPVYLNTFQQRLKLLKSKLGHFIQTVDPAVGYDLDWLLVRICEPALLTIQFIAYQVPPTVPVDLDLFTSTNALASQLQAAISDGEAPDFPSGIGDLPNPDWNAVFKGYCRVLEASVDAYLIGDTPAYKVKLADAAAPDLVFRILRDLISGLNKFPFLRPYHNRLLRKLDGSRSGTIYTEFWMTQIPPKSDTPKRKIDTPDSHRPAKK
ncbi:hypothetical protein E0Z10_g2396 [Xylaria hypoxylon]|uniref:Uncharacterized protein n=1 Tax=Xylaria hypoxylon TaxID=37992 RepID=A0A4Z0Z2K0_9PEZI|nr:hypothetical protein E0Z10_g2396 [Xylaria hypoxylon]